MKFLNKHKFLILFLLVFVLSVGYIARYIGWAGTLLDFFGFLLFISVMVGIVTLIIYGVSKLLDRDDENL